LTNSTDALSILITVRAFNLLILLVILTAPTAGSAYYYTYPYGRGNLYLDGSFFVSKGTTESIKLYAQYGVIDNLDLNINIPGVVYYDSQTKTGQAFYPNPTAGYFLSFINNENNKLGTFANFELPFRNPKGLNADVGLLYSGKAFEKWNLLTGLDLPINKYRDEGFSTSLKYIIGTEYTNGNFFYQLTFNISEQVTPRKEFGFGADWYIDYTTSIGSPYIELVYDVRPFENWGIYIGYYKLINLL